MIIIVYFSSLHNFVMFKDICKWDLLPLMYLKVVEIRFGASLTVY